MIEYVDDRMIELGLWLQPKFHASDQLYSVGGGGWIARPGGVAEGLAVRALGAN